MVLFRAVLSVLIAIFVAPLSPRVVFAQDQQSEPCVVVAFSLINTVTGDFIRFLNDYDTINLDLTGKDLTIVSLTYGGPPDLLLFTLTGPKGVIHNVEFAPPFALSGMEGSIYNTAPELSVPGKYQLVATPLFLNSAQGESGLVHFTVQGGSVPTTKAPVVPPTTKPPIKPTKPPSASPIATASPSRKPSSAPVKAPVTKAPVTKAPVTKAPVPATKAPVTKAPVTKAPVPVTKAPVPVTKAPVPVTKAPVPVTKAPVPVTKAPVPVTKAPVPVTKAPVPVTKAPLPVTKAPIPAPAPTKAPVSVAKPTLPPSTDVPGIPASASGTVSGDVKKWHKMTLGFLGPDLSETSIPNPFLEYRLTVTFVHVASGKTSDVPGYFAADGNAANSGANSGRVWACHFSPYRAGVWNWTAAFRQGKNLAILPLKEAGVSAGYFDGATGSIEVARGNKTADFDNYRDFRRRGLLQYVGEHYYQFAGDSSYFLKAGSDAPENFLAYDEFDNTPNYGERRKSWEPHVQDYNTGDPTWADGKGKGIIGAINYLSSMGMNAFSFLTMNIAGDDQNVFPYISDQPQDRLRFDVSKLAQWEVLFEHADHMGMYMHFKTQETENDQLLDGGGLGLERKLYYRELIARFSHHLALSWNLGEENTNTLEQREAFVGFFLYTDPYRHPIDMHTFPNDKKAEYTGLLGLSGFTGASLQSHPNNVHSDTLEWRQKSQDANQKWVVTNDEQNPADIGVLPDANDPSHDIIRINALWGNLMAGGSGVEYYFGYKYPDSDLSCQDFRSREIMWQQTRVALQFFNKYVPFWRMTPVDENVSDDNWMLVSDDKDDFVAVVYIRSGLGTATVTGLPSQKSYSIGWFDPQAGGSLQVGSKATLAVGADTNSSNDIGQAPHSPELDWAVLLKSIS